MRLTSLDYFRGMTIFFMILVSLPGNYYTTHPALLHASWHGFTPTDLVFPSFLFASGNAIALTVGKYNLPNHLLVMKVIKRAIIIFTLGILLYWFPFIDFLAKELRFFPVSDIRFLGVLQRIAIVYALVSIMSIYISTRGIAIIALLILPVYWLLLYQLPHGIDPLSIKDNAVLFIDKRIIGDAHLYKGEGFPFDPEGLLSTIPSLVNAMAGFITARFIKARGISALSVLQLMVAGVMMIAVAYIWSYSLPFNKKIWTSSFALYTSGLDVVIISCIMLLIDILKKKWLLIFFISFGKNPLFIYLLFECTGSMLYLIHIREDLTLYHWIFNTFFSWASGYLGSFLFALFFALIFWLVANWLDKRKIYIRI